MTAGGLMLPDSARERPMSGSVVRVGPGKRDKDGSRKTPKVCLWITSSDLVYAPTASATIVLPRSCLATVLLCILPG